MGLKPPTRWPDICHYINWSFGHESCFVSRICLSPIGPNGPVRWSFAKLYKIRPDLVPHVADAKITDCFCCLCDDFWWSDPLSWLLVFELFDVCDLWFCSKAFAWRTVPAKSLHEHAEEDIWTIGKQKSWPLRMHSGIVANHVVLWPKVARIQSQSIDT